MHFQVSQKEKELPVPMGCDRRLFKSALSDLQGSRTQPRLNLRPLSCRMSLSGTFVFMRVPGWSLNQISLTCSQDACRRHRDGSLFCARIDPLPAKRLCFCISWGRKCILPFIFFRWYCITIALTSSVIIVLFLQREHWRTAVLNVQLLCKVSSNVLSHIKVTSLKRKIASALWFSLRLAK